ncbi:MAG TPA: hypothetical protein VFG32_04880 [Bacteroidota bacterium]|nr:hypothetical protein [Bacteroidota bacterium]
MKSTIITLAVIFVGLSTLGSSCINDPFLISINVDPLTGCYTITPGSNLTFGGADTIDLATLVDDSYTDKIKNARFYDIRVQVTGTYNGSVFGVGFINDIPLLNYGSGTNATSPTPWSSFATEQSLVGPSPFIKPQTAGITELIQVLQTRPLSSVRLSSNGTLSGQSPVPSGLQVCIKVYAQADAEIGGE